jgi:hypothetical protein
MLETKAKKGRFSFPNPENILKQRQLLKTIGDGNWMTHCPVMLSVALEGCVVPARQS